jgi:hypothetical protein
MRRGHLSSCQPGARLLKPEKAAAQAPAPCAPAQSCRSGTESGAPDRRDRRVAIAIARPALARGQKQSRRAEVAHARIWAKAIVRCSADPDRPGRSLRRRSARQLGGAAKAKGVVRRRDRRRRHVGHSESRPIDAGRFSTSASSECARVTARAAAAVAARSVARLVSRPKRCRGLSGMQRVRRRSISAVSDMASTTCTHLVTAYSGDMTCPTSWV